jgi:tetratricopeptide (TPR) repeat protein
LERAITLGEACIRRRGVGPDSEETIEAYTEYGRILAKTGEYDRALDAHDHAISLGEAGQKVAGNLATWSTAVIYAHTMKYNTLCSLRDNTESREVQEHSPEGYCDRIIELGERLITDQTYTNNQQPFRQHLIRDLAVTYKDKAGFLLLSAEKPYHAAQLASKRAIELFDQVITHLGGVEAASRQDPKMMQMQLIAHSFYAEALKKQQMWDGAEEAFEETFTLAERLLAIVSLDQSIFERLILSFLISLDIQDEGFVTCNDRYHHRLCLAVIATLQHFRAWERTSSPTMCKVFPMLDLVVQVFELADYNTPGTMGAEWYELRQTLETLRLF